MSTIYGHQEDANGNLLLPTTHSMATVELGSNATQPYAKGDLVIWNNRLCQATRAISANDAFAINTNLQYTTMNAQLNNIKVYVNSSGDLVYRDHTGADSVLNFSQIYDLGTGTTFNVSSISGYHNFTTANFMYRIGNANAHLVNGNQGQGWFAGSGDFSDSYNSSTGVLTVSYRAYLMTPNSGQMHGSLTSVHAYLITKTSGIRPLPNS